MEIKEFVATVLKDIVYGLNDASQSFFETKTGAIINPMMTGERSVRTDGGGSRLIQQVEMTIAVTVSDSKEKGGDAGIKVALFSAGLASAEATRNSTVSTVKFAVPIAFPVGKTV